MRKYEVIKPFFNRFSLVVEQTGNTLMLTDEQAEHLMGKNVFNDTYIKPCESAEKTKKKERKSVVNTDTK